jgi:hypothetical protein
VKVLYSKYKTANKDILPDKLINRRKIINLSLTIYLMHASTSNQNK